MAAEVKLLRQCTHWLKQLEDGEEVCVNLRPDADPETEYVRFDRHRVIRVLERIAADLDPLTQGQPTEVEGDALNEHKEGLLNCQKCNDGFPHGRNTLRAEINLPPT